MGFFDTVINDFRRKKDDLINSRFNVLNQTRSAIALAKPTIQQGIQRVQQTPKREFFLPTSKSFLDTPILPKQAAGYANQQPVNIRNLVVKPTQRILSTKLTPSRAFNAFNELSMATPPGPDDIISGGLTGAGLIFGGLKNVNRLKVTPNINKLYPQARTALKLDQAISSTKPVLTFLGGVPGAGKSEARKLVFPQLEKGRVVIDIDNLKKLIPGFDERNPEAVHELSKALGKKGFSEAVSNKKNILFDSTLSNFKKYKGFIDEARKQ